MAQTRCHENHRWERKSYVSFLTGALPSIPRFQRPPERRQDSAEHMFPNQVPAPSLVGSLPLSETLSNASLPYLSAALLSLGLDILGFYPSSILVQFDLAFP